MTLPVFSKDHGTTLSYPLAGALNCSRLVLGCMHFGGTWEREGTVPTDARKAARVALETALELGWDVFDHADIYCRGRSELVFGELLRELKIPRESVIIQTKCGICFPDTPDAGDPHRYDFRREYIIESLEGSLKRLGVDYVDCLLLHRPDFLADPDEVMEAFTELHGSGKVGFFGVSNFTPPLLELFKGAGFVPVANQVEFNLLKTALIDGTMVSQGRDPHPGCTVTGTLEWHRRHGVVTQAWAPLAYGYASGRPMEKDPERAQRLSALVEELANAYGVAPEAVVIGWLLRHPAHVQPVIGTRDPQRLKACHEALSLSLAHKDWYRLYHASRQRELP